MVKTLLAQDCVHANQKDIYGRTPLFGAAVRGHETVLQLLLNQDGIEPDVVDLYGRTAQMDAVRMGHLHAAQLFDRNQLDGSHNHESWISSPRRNQVHSQISCNICLADVPNSDNHHHCGSCVGGDFDACQDCIGRGAFCFDRSHSLTKRRVEDGKPVEVRS